LYQNQFLETNVIIEFCEEYRTTMLQEKRTYSDFVISRAVENRDLAAWIAGLIEMQGRTITLQDEFYQHKDFLHLIGDALESQTRVVALLSSEFLDSEACLQEAHEVIKGDPLNKKQRLILFRIDGCRASGKLANIAFTDLVPILQQQDARKVAETVLKTLGSSGKTRLDFMPPLPQGNHLVKTTILHPEIHYNQWFTGRNKLITDLLGKAAPRPGTPTILSNTQEVAKGDTGLAGIGKSTLAREFAWRQKANYTGVWWLPASSRSGIVQGLIDLGERLTPPVHAIESREGAAKMVVEALETRSYHKPWLLIYDNVTTNRALENLVPRDGAEVLITTRWSDLYGYHQKVDVDVFSPELAVWYLGNLSGENDPETASNLAADLGYLPLSLRLAGSYCQTRGVKLKTYHDLFKSTMSKRPRLRDVPWKHSDSLYVAFNLALDAIVQGDIENNVSPLPLASILMGVAAFYASDNIPLDLFQVSLPTFPGTLSASSTTCPHSSRHFDSHVSRSITPYEGNGSLGSGQTIFSIEPRDLSDVVMALVETGLFSQVEMQGGEPGLGMHWLVQEMMRARLAEEGHEDAMAGLATGLLAEAFPGGPGEENDPGAVASWPRCEQLLPHAMALFEHIPENGELSSPTSAQQKAGMGGREIAILLNQSGLFLKARGDIDEAEKLLRRGLEINKVTYGDSHDNVAISLNNLASTLQDKGWLFEAEPLFMEALKIDEKRKGRRHADVARDLFNLGQLFQAMGRENDVEALYHRSLLINVKNFGRNHVNVAIILNSLGQLYEQNDQGADAEALYRRALAIDENHYGSKHPYVARDMEAIAKLLVSFDRHAEAEPLFRKVLLIDERTLGPDHPDVAANLNNLAVLLEENRGDYVQSEKLKRRALRIDELCYGPNHPNVARDLNNLALLLRATDRLKEAEPAMRRVIDIFEKSLGPDHQNVATTLNNLADLLRETERFDEAETLYRRALKIDEQNFGLDHHTIARDFNNLSLLLKITGRCEEAEPYARRALEILENKLPETHPWVQRARSNLVAIEVDLDSQKDPVVFQPASEFDLAVLGEQAHQSEGNNLWDLFDEEVKTRKQRQNPLRSKILSKLLRKKDKD
jgi:tetratricopeptide (TPR) repeat protein